LKVSNAPNYGVHKSLVHSGAYGGLDAAAHTTLLEKARNAPGVTQEQFTAVSANISRYVDRLYSHQDHDLIFKGKWYECFFVEDATTIAGLRRFERAHLEERVFACLLATMDFTGKWADHLHASVASALDGF